MYPIICVMGNVSDMLVPLFKRAIYTVGFFKSLHWIFKKPLLVLVGRQKHFTIPFVFREVRLRSIVGGAVLAKVFVIVTSQNRIFPWTTIIFIFV